MPRMRITTQQKLLVAGRAFNCCEYCWSQADFATEPFSVEHIIPISRGGENNASNLALACQGCNGHKYAKTMARDPVDGASVPLYHPRQHKWSEHFHWNENFTLIIGVTPTGRATVEALHMNRPSVVNLRRALYTLGEHPLIKLKETL
ncbi:MAG: HNH endonuclease signature motif containing protein [Caldilineaceae bacterium]